MGVTPEWCLVLFFFVYFSFFLFFFLFFFLLFLVVEIRRGEKKKVFILLKGHLCRTVFDNSFLRIVVLWLCSFF